MKFTLMLGFEIFKLIINKQLSIVNYKTML